MNMHRIFIYACVGIIFAGIGLVWWQTITVMFVLWSADALDAYLKQNDDCKRIR